MLAFFLLLILTGSAVAEQSTDTAKSFYNDGPHIFWDNDTTAVVLYCDEMEMIADTFYSSTMIEFNGLGYDSGNSYRIPVGEKNINKNFEFTASKIFALSDLHGEYEYLIDILKNNRIVDQSLHWSWGDGCLIIVGDIFDRGDMVTECLWLIYRLEQEAQAVGGQVHFTLGNHELMVLRGDNRYINEKYTKGICRKTRIRHEDLVGVDMELGRWLRTKPVAIKINEILFVHGGISPDLVKREITLADLNRTFLSSVDLSSSRLVFASESKFLFSSLGPFWYRGYHYEMENRYSQATVAEIDMILEFYDAKTIVVGHTEQDSLASLYENRIFGIDVPVAELNGFQALLWQDGAFYRVSSDGDLIRLD